MRKSLFLTLVLSLCIADFGAFAANARGGRTGAPAASGAGVAARSATRKTAGSIPGVSGVSGVPGVSDAPAIKPAPSVKADSARAGKKQQVKQPMAARAGATQKVINNGTKVATATANTVVPQECQDAFFGCMDSFCMIDNEAGGRCQCSDRNEELKKVLDEIAKLDEQSYAMATDGVKHIEMGESAEQVMKRAQEAADKVTGKASQTTSDNKKKSRTLDLSAWNNSVFDEDSDVFESLTASIDGGAVSEALSKTGIALYKDSAKMCLAQVQSQLDAQCKSHMQMLQSMYAQKIKSDCTAFENSLKQQKNASQQKLRAAREALNEAALEDYKDKNWKLGQCVQEYSKCMKTECGEDYAQCITFAAQENMKGGAGDEKARTIKGFVDIVLSGSTMNQLMSKKTICDDEVLVHCEKYRTQVWDKYIEGAATEVKAAELAAEDDMRQNCIKSSADCFKNSCAASWDPNKDSTNYDMCLADPMMVYESCKIKIEPCLVATGATGTDKTGLKNSSLWTGVTSMLAALRVDACTEELKAEIEKNCGKDFSNCIGLSSGGIVNLVAEAKLTACQDRYNDQNYLTYIESVAKGYKLQLDSSVADACQKAVDAAMVAKCGSTDACETATLSKQSVKNLLKVQVCAEYYDKDAKKDKESCYDNLESFGDDAKYKNFQVRIVKPKMEAIRYNYETTTQTSGRKPDFFEFTNSDDTITKEAANLLNTSLKMKLSEINNDSKVDKCVNGNKALDGTNETTGLKTFSNLTKNAEITIADSLLANFWKVYDEELTAFAKDKIPELTKQITEKIAKANAEAKAEAEAASKDATAESLCKKYEDLTQPEPSVHGCTRYYLTYSAAYDKGKHTCTVTKTLMGRKTWCWCGAACQWGQAKNKMTKTFTADELIAGTDSFDRFPEEDE